MILIKQLKKINTTNKKIKKQSKDNIYIIIKTTKK